jgi:hypothetical protein
MLPGRIWRCSKRDNKSLSKVRGESYKKPCGAGAAGSRESLSYAGVKPG